MRFELFAFIFPFFLASENALKTRAAILGLFMFMFMLLLSKDKRQENNWTNVCFNTFMMLLLLPALLDNKMWLKVL